MGSVGTSITTTYSSEFQYFLDNAGGDKDYAVKDWISENVSDTFEKGGTEYTILWEQGVFPHIISEASAENPDMQFTIEVSAVRTAKLDDENAVRQAKSMYIPAVRGKGHRVFTIQVYR